VIDEMRKLEGPVVVVVTADHGDELGERGRLGQHRTVHRECLHVPLIIHIPGAEPSRVKEAVSTIDIYPTLADIAGQPIPEGVRGHSLLPGIFTGSMKGRGAVFSEVAWRFEEPPEQWAAATLGNARLLVEIRGGRRELFLLDTDPLERRNLYGKGDPHEQEIEDAMNRFLETTTVLKEDTVAIP